MATRAGRVLNAGKKLLGGHVGGALEAITGSGGASSIVARTAGLAAVAAAAVGAAHYLLKETASLIGLTTRPELQSTWFSSSYWRMASVSALLTLPFLFAAAVQALIRADLGLLARSAFGYLPLAMLAVGVAVPLTVLLLAASDEMSTVVSSASGNAGADYLARTGAVAALLAVGGHGVFLALLVGLLTAVATLVLWGELLIRSAAVYVIVFMLPLFFAAMVWPARRAWAVRAVELLVALILSKFAIVAVLALGGAALSHALIPGTAAFLGGVTLILLAAFSPWALLRLLPLHELAAAAAGGLRSAAGRTPLTLANDAYGFADFLEAAPANERSAQQSEAAAGPVDGPGSPLGTGPPGGSAGRNADEPICDTASAPAAETSSAPAGDTAPIHAAEPPAAPAGANPTSPAGDPGPSAAHQFGQQMPETFDLDGPDPHRMVGPVLPPKRPAGTDEGPWMDDYPDVDDARPAIVDPGLDDQAWAAGYLGIPAGTEAGEGPASSEDPGARGGPGPDGGPESPADGEAPEHD